MQNVVTVTDNAGTEIFSTTLVETLTITTHVPVHVTTQSEVSTFIITETTTTTTHVPTNSGYLPIESTFINLGIYENSLPAPVKRDLLPRGNITIVTGDKETVFDETDCVCDSDRNIFPASVECKLH